MLIRNAKESDIKKIIDITSRFNIQRDSDKNSGFVEFPILSKFEYDKLIKSPYFYIIENENSFIGFISAFVREFLEQLDEKDEIVDYLLKNKLEEFVYIEQIAVLEEFQSKGIATQLVMKILKEIDQMDIYTTISHSPIKNIKSINLFKKIGFKKTEEIKICKGLIFGIYKLKEYIRNNI